jgi:predicted short-subunit dehydrogenase-like oxidoreductase (DUF2520 family)
MPYKFSHEYCNNPSALAYEWDTESANYMTLLNREADLYVIAVADGAIAQVAGELHLPGSLVVHTAASVSKDVLSRVSDDYGVLYPLQSLRSEMETIPEIPLYIDASNDRSMRRLKTLADSLSPRPAQAAGDEQRVKLHLAAVIASNFTNHLYALAEGYCKKEGIDYRQLYPLIVETASRLGQVSAAGLQTGPAVRGDEATISRHLALLESDPHLQRIYRMMSDSIRESA